MSIDSVSGVSFTGELEKHISDYRRGRPENSKLTSQKLASFDHENYSLIGTHNPEAQSLYGLFGTFMTYTKRARYTSNINAAFRQISRMYA